MKQDNNNRYSAAVEQAVGRMREIMAMGSADLHIHTTHSDGYENPATVVQNAIRYGMAAFAVTDHDTTQAVLDIHRVLHKLDLVQLERPVFVPGVEASASLMGQEIHLLAYFPFGGEYRLGEFLSRQQLSRDKRNRAMCEKLVALGCPISYKMLTESSGTMVGREHMATILVREGYRTNTKACFDELLADGRPAAVDRELEPAADVLRIIRKAGGVPVLAHPFKYQWYQDPAVDLCEQVNELKSLGLEGIETVHGSACDDDMARIAAVGRKLGLLRTSGSDFHITYGSVVNKLRSELNYSRYLE